MKLNYETCLAGTKVTLVPYRPEHVEKYHEWMKDPKLLELTGSEPLSMEEEIEMQQSWHQDPTKCTFIVHDSASCHINEESKEFLVPRNIGAMVGDVNLFLSDFEPDEDDVDSQDNDDKPRIQAEVDIMIAEKDYKRQGLGKSATCTMLIYGATELGVYRFFCKINEDNLASIKLFESLGFVQCNYAACFKQVELELIKPLEELNKTLRPFGTYRTIKCPIVEHIN